MTKDDYHARTSNGDIMNDGCADDTRRRVGGRVIKAKQWRADSERRNREPPPTLEQRQQETQMMKELLARRANPPSEEEKAEGDEAAKIAAFEAADALVDALCARAGSPKHDRTMRVIDALRVVDIEKVSSEKLAFFKKANDFIPVSDDISNRRLAHTIAEWDFSEAQKLSMLSKNLWGYIAHAEGVDVRGYMAFEITGYDALGVMQLLGLHYHKNFMEMEELAIELFYLPGVDNRPWLFEHIRRHAARSLLDVVLMMANYVDPPGAESVPPLPFPFHERT